MVTPAREGINPMRKARTFIYALIAACAIGTGAVALAASASAATPIVATTSVSAHPDTTNASGTGCKPSAGGPVWALDAYTSTMSAIQTGASTWRVTLQDNGSFAGFADPATCKASLSAGAFTGDYTVSVSSPVAPSAAFLHKSYSGAVSTTQMITDFFDDAIGVTVTGGDYFFIYQGGNYVQTTSSIYGDVVPAPAPVLSLAYCGSHVWKVTQNKSLISTKFHYFSKVGTTYLLDGAATVASGSSVKVTERPRAVGGLQVRYPSGGNGTGKIITVIGSRTQVAC